MQDRVFVGLTVMFGIATALNALVFWLIVCRKLYRAGSRFPTGLLPWRYFQDMARYKDICRSQSDSLSHYYIIMLAVWFNVALAAVLAMGWLYRLQNLTP